MKASYGESWDEKGRRWEAAGDPDVDATARLLSQIVIAGCPMHVWAIAIVTGEDETQTPAPGSYWSDEHFASLHDAAGGDGYWQTVTLGHEKREYILVCEPHS